MTIKVTSDDSGSERRVPLRGPEAWMVGLHGTTRTVGYPTGASEAAWPGLPSKVDR